MSTSFVPVSPVSPVAGYIGGKRNLSKRICAIIERTPHTSYAEPFVGMGGIFLRRKSRPRAEAINDISGDVVTLFRCLAEHYPYLVDMLRFRVASRAEFQRLLGQDPDRLTDLQRAVRFLYVQRLAFGGKVSGRTFGVDASSPARFDVSKLEPMLADLHDRLQSVVIERLPYADFIRRYDREGALFYLDPPYWACETDYGKDVFTRADFAALAEQLAGINGKCLISLNDNADVRETFSRFSIVPIKTTYTVGANAIQARELLISNFAVPAND
ncbi:DNA adenine methylase [Novosphingobium sp. P6W]|uniref:DNA adenine methylase n=1 Tax=Novosphingobium sp. P6W TaxID=1609758 RepID=UPI0005C2E917|nr:DNA adenine methylase [Novosphingobium sp. P6W]AXB75467.1 DNA adenine methylase [Novosphingobium sp. P6W]KIS32507.1 DNA methyltransferase [Novosphingobium sp. P6W]